MKCLTKPECSAWLETHAIIEAPYENPRPVNADIIQFAPPKSSPRLIAFSRQLFDWIGNLEAGLLQINDWPFYQPDEMVVINAIRRSHGELRPLIEAPGHLFEPKEKDELIALFYLTIMFGWSAYLYLLPNKATVLNWEGDLIDLWSFDKQHFAAFKEIQATFQLKETGES
jgi:hypothetical protein